MRGIMADNNIQGQVDILVYLLESETWRELWNHLELIVYTFDDLGLLPGDPDAVVWDSCQRNEIVLITNNRNDDGPDSLETTLRTRNTATSLPVLTLADAEHVRNSGAYATRVVERLIDILLEIDNYRGTGRLYLP